MDTGVVEKTEVTTKTAVDGVEATATDLAFAVSDAVASAVVVPDKIEIDLTKPMYFHTKNSTKFAVVKHPLTFMSECIRQGLQVTLTEELSVGKKVVLREGFPGSSHKGSSSSTKTSKKRTKSSNDSGDSKKIVHCKWCVSKGFSNIESEGHNTKGCARRKATVASETSDADKAKEAAEVEDDIEHQNDAGHQNDVEGEVGDEVEEIEDQSTTLKRTKHSDSSNLGYVSLSNVDYGISGVASAE